MSYDTLKTISVAYRTPEGGVFELSLFKRKEPVPTQSPYSLEQYEPVIRSSICTGEMTACMRNRETGKLHELMIIRDSEDLNQFAKVIGVDPETIRTVY